jgi:hypothetical protein
MTGNLQSISLALCGIAFVAAFFVIDRRLYKGVTPSYFAILLAVWVPNYLFGPFAYHELVTRYVGHYYHAIRQHLPEAFVLANVMAVFFLLGYALWGIWWRNRWQGRHTSLKAGRAFTAVFFDRSFLLVMLVGILAMALATFAETRQLGVAREYAMLSTSVLFKVQVKILGYLARIVGLVALLRFSMDRSYIGLALTVLVIGFAGLVIGVRGLFILPVLYAIFFYMAENQRVVSLRNLILGATLVFVGLSISALRSNDFGETNLLMDLLYGNNFSDYRDFAWLLSSIQEPLNGKTIWAGIQAIFPIHGDVDSIYYFWGNYSAEIAGLDTTRHAGLRPIFLGEFYLNFGTIGLAMASTIFGAFFSAVSAFYYASKLKGEPAIRRAIVPVLLMSLVTANLSAGYRNALVFPLLVLGSLLLYSAMRSRRGAKARGVDIPR